MIPKGLFTQIGMMIIAVGIALTYVQPAFDDIKSVQDDIARFQQERQKVADVNQLLNRLVTDMENVSPNDRLRLLTYMPDAVDSIAVSRDLLFITRESGALYKNVQFSESGGSRSSNNRTGIDNSGLPTPHHFSLSVEGTYNQVKKLFELIEQNNYPLEVHNTDISVMEGGFLNVNVELVAYAYKHRGLDKEIIY
ncbi:hypothetical protein KC906_01285 [Candidatus Kaiserbacteria bacterium]|nr:hypothetical protein [Candidatus Kaiserbacteria bacterium]MCB9812175.1 hypothetical protein [Candidatus Nomurabacteria bacterium]